MEALRIDYRIIIAQIINFGLILFLLLKLLYKPIEKVLKERQEKIEKGVVAGEKAQKIIEEAKKAAQIELNKAREEIKKMIRQAREEAEKERGMILIEGKRQAQKFLEEKEKVLTKKIGEEEKKMEKRIVELAIQIASRLTQDFISKNKEYQRFSIKNAISYFNKLK